MANDNPNRNITRIENPGDGEKRAVKGFEVRIYRRGQRFNQFFADDAYGNKKKALNEARTVRDKMEKKLKPFSRKELAVKVTKRNTSGVRGVRVRKTVVTKNGKTYTYEHVEASWSPVPGEVIKKSFSVEKMGLDAAWKAAIEVREKAVAKLKG